MADFGSQVAGYVDRYKKRLRATAKLSVEKTIEEMQTPESKAGRLPFDTGFLQHSLSANIGSMPMGESVNPGGSFTYTGDAVEAVLIRWNPDQGETFYAGYTANYARYMEARNGFVRGVAEKWPDTVDQVGRKVRREI